MLCNTVCDCAVLIYFENLCLLILHARNDILHSEASVILHYRISYIDFPPSKSNDLHIHISLYSFQPIAVINYTLIWFIKSSPYLPGKQNILENVKKANASERLMFNSVLVFRWLSFIRWQAGVFLREIVSSKVLWNLESMPSGLKFFPC